MKYLVAMLILIGGLLLLALIVYLGIRIKEKFEELEHDFECKHKRYYNFKEKLNNKIMPWVAGIFILGLFLFCLVAGYFKILEAL